MFTEPGRQPADRGPGGHPAAEGRHRPAHPLALGERGLPQPEAWYGPRDIANYHSEFEIAQDIWAHMTTCDFSPLLSAIDETCPPIVGPPPYQSIMGHLMALKRLGFAVSSLRFGSEGETITISSRTIEAFRERFGTRRRTCPRR